jgi:hypothetical protein
MHPCLDVGGWHNLEGLQANLRDKNNGQFETIRVTHVKNNGVTGSFFEH